MAVLLLVGGGALGATVHAQAASPTGTSRTVHTQHILKFSEVDHNASGPSPLVVSNDCLGTTLFGYSPSAGNWTSYGTATNGCPVDMKSAVLAIEATMNCPLGNVTNAQNFTLAPPNWPNTIAKQWTLNGVALCYVCSNGLIIPEPYNETITASVYGSGTDNRGYNSGNPVSVNFPMKNFPKGTPC